MVKKVKNLQYYEAVGKRKEAVARVRLFITGKDKTVTINGIKIKAGEIFVNSKPIKNLFSDSASQSKYQRPLKITQNIERFAVSIHIKGGGTRGQLDAIILGIARALNLVDRENYRPLLKKQGLLTRDSRVRERRKVGTGGKARRKKQSPKR